MERQTGFTLIEVVVFILISSIFFTAMGAIGTSLRNLPSNYYRLVAQKTAQQCGEWFYGQRMQNGYDSIATGTTVPSFCTVPTGYTISVNVTATPYHGANDFKTILINVGGRAQATISLMVGG